MSHTTDFGYEMSIDNDGEIQLLERDHEGDIVTILYLSQRDIESMFSMIKEGE